MIHIPNKYTSGVPARLLNQRALIKIKTATDSFNGDVYQGYYKNITITNQLKAFSICKNQLELGDKPKCNYCESRVEKGATLQVEHYRPKSKVEAIDNNNFEHHGYYWLGLEWTNLLLSCPKCNGKSAKGNRFPILGQRAIPFEPVNSLYIIDRTACIANQNPLLSERPVLLNPEIDFPELSLTFNAQSFISGYGPDAYRGEETKEILRLNRDPLIADRQEIRNNFVNDILLDIGGFLIGELDNRALFFNFKKTCRAIRRRSEADQEFALWGRFINNNIELTVVSYIDIDFKELFREAFQHVLNEENG